MNVKERIIAGFRELSFTVGFHGATVDELSARTGISKRTIYRYFRSKDEMIDAVVDEFIASVQSKADHAMSLGDNPMEKVTSLVRLISQHLRVLSPVIMRDMQKYYPHVWTRIENFRAAKARSLVEMLIAGNQEGYFRETDPAVFIAALLAAIRDVISPAFILDHNLTVEKTIPVLFDIFLYGIVSDEARKAGPGEVLPPGREEAD